MSTTGTPALVEAALTAAAAAAAVLPAPLPLVPGPVDGSLAPDPSATAVVASFTGAVSGEVVVVVDPAVVDALAAAEGGPLSVEDAVRPALEAAVATLGIAVLAPARATTASEVVGSAGLQLVPLLGGDEVSGWVGLRLHGRGPAEGGVPAQRGPRSAAANLNLLRDVEMTVTVELGRARLSVRELLALVPGSVVELDRAAGAPADLMVNGRLLARGEVVVVDEDYGIRITEIVEPGGEG